MNFLLPTNQNLFCGKNQWTARKLFAESMGRLCGGGAHCHCHYPVIATVIQDRDRYWYYCYYYCPCYRDRYCYCVCFYCYLFWCSVRLFFRFSSIKLDHKLFCEERNSLKSQYVEVLAISVNYFNICELLTHPSLIRIIISIVVKEWVEQEQGFCLLRHRGTELPVNTILHHQNKTSRHTKAHFVHVLFRLDVWFFFLLLWVSCVN